jgi:hypothetical protein
MQLFLKCISNQEILELFKIDTTSILNNFIHTYIKPMTVPIYIVWKTKYDDAIGSNILGIYKDKDIAWNEYTKFYGHSIISSDEDDVFEPDENVAIASDACQSEENDIEICHDGLLGHYSAIDTDDVCYCSQFEISQETEKIYFMKINEDGGAENYHLETQIYAWFDENYLINIAEEYFLDEHNRDNECQNCHCEEHFMKDLRETKRAYFYSAGYDFMFHIWSHKI